jgi:hypothetical protein
MLVNDHTQTPFYLMKYKICIHTGLHDVFYGQYNLVVDKPFIFNFFNHERYKIFGIFLSSPIS